MKILLAVMMSTVLAGSAFGACSDTTPAECTTEATCEGLSKAEGKKFSFNKSLNKCMVKDTVVATNCLEGNDTPGSKRLQPAGGPGGPGAEKKTGEK